MQFKWTVNKVQVVENNLVTRVDLTVTATDGDNTASAVYTCNLVRGDSFIPYNELTEQQVLDWCFKPVAETWLDINNVKQSTTRLLKNNGETQVAGQIASQLAQKVAEPALPWL